MSIQNVYPELSSAQFSTGGAPSKYFRHISSISNSSFDFHFIIVVQVTVVGPYPIQIKCPSCHTDVKTKAIYEAGTKTHIFAALLCLFGYE